MRLHIGFAVLWGAIALTPLVGCSDDSTSPGNPSPILLRVDYQDFLDDDPATNFLIFSGVYDAMPESTVTANGNFPELDLRDFFVTDQTGSGETAALAEGLADYTGRTYGRLFLSGHLGPEPETDIPLRSLGLLATNRQDHDFDIAEVAFVGHSVFDASALGLTAADFGTGGDLYAQDFPFKKIGRWEAVVR